MCSKILLALLLVLSLSSLSCEKIEVANPDVGDGALQVRVIEVID